MELLAEIIVWVGQLLLELLLQLLFEILAELGLKAVKKAIRPAGAARPVQAFIGYILLGGTSAGVSLVFFPHKFAVPMWLQIANLVVSPVVMGFAMVGIWPMASAARPAGNPFAHVSVWSRFCVGLCAGAV